MQMRGRHHRVDLWKLAGANILCVGLLILNERAAAQDARRQISSGRVVDALSGTGLSGARIVVRSFDASGNPLPAVPPVETSADGGFEFSSPPGTRNVSFSVTKPGYRHGYLGPLDWLPRQYSVAAEGSKPVLRLWPSATVEGLVNLGDSPLVGARVQAWERVYFGGGYRWITGSALHSRTDDRGAYRLENLSPGAYVITVNPPDAAGFGFGAWFYPTTRIAATASVISVDAGDRNRADFVLPEQHPGSSLVGKVTGSDGEPIRVDVVAEDAQGQPLDYSRLTVTTDTTGGFSFHALGAGRYRVSTFRFPRGLKGVTTIGGDSQRILTTPGQRIGEELIQIDPGPTVAAVTSVHIESGETNRIELMLRPAARISGRIVFDASAAAPKTISSVPVIVRPADGTDLGPIPQLRVEPNLAFTTVGLPAGQYVIGFLPGLDYAGWRVHSVRVNGRDTLGDPITLIGDISGVEIHLTSRRTELLGIVSDRVGRRTQDAHVIAFPESERDWHYFVPPAVPRVVRAQLAPDGTFRVGLPAGRYRVLALSSFDPEWMAPAFLRKVFSEATAVDVQPGSSASVSLVVR